MLLDAYADGPVKLSVAFTAGRSRIHYETPAVSLSQGWSKDICFDLNARNFKSSATQWGHSSRLGLRRIVREVVVLLERVPDGASTVHIDNIRFEQDPAEVVDESLPVVVELAEPAPTFAVPKQEAK
jgi:hypothetical protein